jgi:hypothetical protein
VDVKIRLNLGMAMPCLRRLVTGLAAEGWVLAQVCPCGICFGQSCSGTGFSPCSLVFPCQMSFRHSSPYSYITWRMKNSPIGGCSSETSCPIDMNNKFGYSESLSSRLYLKTCRLKYSKVYFYLLFHMGLNIGVLLLRE